MNIRSFNEYEQYTNGNKEDIVNKIHILTEQDNINNIPFVKINSISEAINAPVLICGDFKISNLNESNMCKVYNSFNFKKGYDYMKKHVGESFIPKAVNNRNNVKRLKFPIVATGKNRTTTYNSLYKFNKSENDYTTFREKVIPKTKYEVLMFNEDIVSVHEKINGELFEKNISKDINNAIDNITKKISESHGFDAYYLTIYESSSGKYYLSKIKKCKSFNEKQSYQLYVKIYEDHYGYNIPTWFKNKIKDINADN